MPETTAPPIVIERLEDVRPGDFLLTNIGGLVPGAFPVGFGQFICGERVRIADLTFDHVLVVTQASRVLPAGSTYEGVLYETGVITAPKGVQAMPRGAEEIELTYAKHWTRKCAYVRLPEDYLGQAGDAAAVARLMAELRIPYSFGSYVQLAAWRFGFKTPWLEKRIDRRLPPRPVTFARGRVMVSLPAEAICSVLGDQVWSATGKRVIEGVSPQCVTPGKFGRQLLFRKGVTWGGPGVTG
jgi:hypothetical protein